MAVTDVGQVFRIVIGILAAVYGLLVLIDPVRYPVGTVPLQYTPLVAIGLLILGVYLLTRED